MRPALRAALLALAAGLLVPLPASAAGAFNPPWLNVPDAPAFLEPGDVSHGWTFRVPLRLPDAAASEGDAVQVQLDLGAAALSAGWPATGSGEGRVPLAFHPDLASLHLVEYSKNWASILDEVPMRTYQGTWLSTSDERTIGPLVTVEWRLPHGPTSADPTSAQFYYVYLDVTENQDPAAPKPEASMSAAESERLDALYWVGAGTMLYTSTVGSRGMIEVVATTDDTTVWVMASEQPEGGSSPEPFRLHTPLVGPASPTIATTNPFTIAKAGDMVRYRIADAPGELQVLADKPVVAFEQAGAGSAGEFFPSLDGTTVGRTFVFPILSVWIVVMVPTGPTATAADFCVTSAVEGGPGGRQCFTNLPPGGYQVVRIQPTRAAAPAFPPSGTRILVEATRGQLMVQSVPRVGATTQAPSTSGSPVGSTFLASTVGGSGTEGFLLEDAGLGSVVELALPQGASSPRSLPPMVELLPGESEFVSSQSRGLAISPEAGRDASAYNQQATPPPKDAGLLHAESRPVTLEADGGPVVVRVGRQQMPVLGQTTPFGGAGSRQFDVAGPFAVYAFFDDTQVEVTSSDPDHASTRVLASTSAPVSFTLPREATSRVQTDKPVAVLPVVPAGSPVVSYGRAFAAKPALLPPPQVLSAEFRGHLLDLRPEAGEDVGLNGPPGTTLELPLLLANLGQWNGQPLDDTVRLQATASGTAVGLEFGAAGLSGDLVDVAGRSSLAVDLRVILPPTMGDDDEAEVTVSATSVGNPRIRSEFKFPVSTHQKLGVEASFGACSSCGVRSIAPSLQPSEAKTYLVSVGNLGSGVDAFDVAVAQVGSQSGWTATLDQGRVATSTGDLAPGASKTLNLRIAAPAAGNAPPATLFVEVRSHANAAVATKLVATAKIASSDSLEVRSPLQFQRVAPGTTTSYVVELVNVGTQDLVVVPEVIAELPEGWTTRILGAADSTRVPLGCAAPARCPGSKAVLELELTVPPGAPSGLLVPLLVKAWSEADPSVTDAVALAAEVLLEHDLVLSPLPSLTARPGETLAIELDVQNRGNGPETVAANATSLPANWTFTPGIPLNLTEGSLATIEAILVVPPDADPGLATVTLGVTTADGVRSEAVLTVTVLPGDEVVWREADPIVLAPGSTTKRSLFVENHGNRPLDVQVAVAAPAGWTATAAPEAFLLPRGGVRLVELSVSAPDAGGESGPIRLSAQAGASDGKLTIAAELERAALGLAKVTASQTPPREGQAGFLTAVLRNQANVTLQEVHVRLLADDQVLDDVRLGALGANATALVPLRWIQDAAAPPDRIVWGLGDAQGFKVLGSQAFTQADAPAARPAPGPAAAPTLAAVAVALALAVRRQGAAR